MPWETCGNCNGSGRVREFTGTGACSHCKGAGYTLYAKYENGDLIEYDETCSTCGGTGTVDFYASVRCSSCGGLGGWEAWDD